VIHVSQEPLEEWGITYRRIPPSYEIYSQMGLYQRNLSTFEETPLIENREFYGTCLNCHTANRTNPDQYVFHIRGDHGATAIVKNGNIELLKAKNEQLGGAMVYLTGILADATALSQPTRPHRCSTQPIH
jgi:hypothetical protein